MNYTYHSVEYTVMCVKYVLMILQQVKTALSQTSHTNSLYIWCNFSLIFRFCVWCSIPQAHNKMMNNNKDAYNQNRPINLLLFRQIVFWNRHIYRWIEVFLPSLLNLYRNHSSSHSHMTFRYWRKHLDKIQILFF